MPESAMLVDGNSLVYRAYFAMPMLNDPSGAPINAVYGFLGMLLRALSEEKPAYLVVAFDMHAPTFRHVRFADYKGTRAPTPDDLRPQFPMVREMLEKMGVCVLRKETYEADDLLGTTSRIFAEAGIPSLIVTGDRDSYQLTGPLTQILYTKRGITDTERITPELIMERYALRPEQLIDMKALFGDTSDNIPGIDGIGEKTAAKLIAKYGDLESCLARADKEEKGKLRERLLEGADIARESRFLAEIDRHVPVDFTPEQARIGDCSGGLVFLHEHAMRSLETRLRELCALYGSPAESAPAAERPEPARIVEDADAFASELAAMQPASRKAILWDSECVTVAEEEKQAVGIRLGGDSLLDMGLSLSDVCELLQPILCSECDKLICNEKGLSREAGAINGTVYDPALAAYVLRSGRKSFRAEALLDEEGIGTECGAAGLFVLEKLQREAMRSENRESLFNDLEMPLSGVLHRMETVGFKADGEYLDKLGESYRAEIARLSDEITALAGHPINIQSPKQLAALLYDELGLSSGRKGADARTTNADVLEQLAPEHPVIEKILAYRKYTKLNGTYIEGLTKLLRAPGNDGRIHTRFDQTGTVTGRLSSLEPNLQNIPVRTEMGREIRKAFIAREGCVLVDADYSQIELRVLAHMSGDERMIEAFCTGEDIHRRTAAEIYSVPIESVTQQMRSAAKAINFGIVYGISEFGLVRNTGLTRTQAGEFMRMYQARYPRIEEFMRSCVENASRNGYAQTLLGRRRYIPELTAGNRNTRMFGERAAMNSPVQGTAADIIKLAMIAVDKALSGLESRLILQVHDELIVEAPLAEAEQVQTLLKDAMENVLTMRVPLSVEVTTGRNWLECK